MAWPTVRSERWTLSKALAGRSLARFGDAELRLAMGPPAKRSKTQEHLPAIQHELGRMLVQPTAALLCLPDLNPRLPNYKRHWETFRKQHWQALVQRTDDVGNSFITRPDSAPHIDEPLYWNAMRELWNGNDIVLVIGEPDANGKHHSLTADHVQEARSIAVVYGPNWDAYKAIDELDKVIGTPKATVILCLGATATCLAERLAKRGVHALDLGHVGKFMPRGK